MPVNSAALGAAPEEVTPFDRTSFIAFPLVRVLVPANQRGFVPLNAAVERTENAVLEPPSSVFGHSGLMTSRADTRLEALPQVISFVLGHGIPVANCIVRAALERERHATVSKSNVTEFRLQWRTCDFFWTRTSLSP